MSKELQEAVVKLGERWHYAMKKLIEFHQMFPTATKEWFQANIGEDFDKTMAEIRTSYKHLGLPVDQSVFLEVEDERVWPRIRERYARAKARRHELAAQGVDLRLS